MGTILVTADFRVQPGETLTFTNETAFQIQERDNRSPNLTIEGRIVVTMTAAPNGGFGFPWIGGIAIGYSGSYDSTVTIASTGVLRVTNTVAGGEATAYDSGSWAPAFVNHGLVEVTANGRAEGLVIWDAGPWQFDNTGALNVTSTAGDARGVFLANGGVVHNTGSIIVSGASPIVQGVYVNGFDGGFYNSGLIRATDGGRPGEAVAVVFYATFGPTDSFLNAGRIEGDVALRVTPYAPVLGGNELFTNSGTMVGKVVLGASSSRLVNSGTIQGTVELEGGDDLYDGRGGRATGMVSGGDGNDSLAGGEGFDNFQGNVGNDSGSAGLGDDWVVGGKDNDSLSGDAGSDLVYGNLGADTCDGGSGNDIVRGGQENDLVSGGDGDDYVSGDKGEDTVTGGAGADLFHTFGDAGIDRVTDFSLAQGDRVLLDAGTQYSLSQVGADTVINMTGGGQMILVGVQLASLTPGWIFGA